MMILFTIILFFLVGIGYAIPVDVSGNSLIIKRDSLYLHVQPNLVNPNCGAVYATTIDVEYSPDPFYLSSSCQNLFTLIGGSNGKQDVNIIFACAKQPVDASSLNIDQTNIVFFVQGNEVLQGADNSDQIIKATMEVIDKAEKLPLTASVGLTFRLDNNKHTSSLREIIC